MSLDFLRDNSNLLKAHEKREAPIDFSDWGRTYSGSVDLYAPKKQLKAQRRVVKLYANNEKEVVDLVARAIVKNPHLVKPISKGLNSGLRALQNEIAQDGSIVDLTKAYNKAKHGNNLLGRLLAMVAKGVITVGNKSQVMAGARGKAITRIRLVSTKATENSNFKKLGRFSGVIGNTPVITRFRISAINELAQPLRIKSGNAYKVLAERYELEKYLDKNDLSHNTTFNLSSLTDEELADCIECGAYTKEEVRKGIDAQRAKRVTRVLQKRFTL